MKKEKSNSKIKELEKKITQLTGGWQRAQADFENYKKRVAQEKIDLCNNSNANLIYDILPVLDNFQLAAKHVPENLKGDNWAQGIRAIEKQLEDVLASEGLERIETIGTKFDPNFHEATEHVASEKPEDEIVEEILAGYKFNNTILRPAKVKVSNGNFHGER
jgi:molecular chaperone GrpE